MNNLIFAPLVIIAAMVGVALIHHIREERKYEREQIERSYRWQVAASYYSYSSIYWAGIVRGQQDDPYHIECAVKAWNNHTANKRKADQWYVERMKAQGGVPVLIPDSAPAHNSTGGSTTIPAAG